MSIEQNPSPIARIEAALDRIEAVLAAPGAGGGDRGVAALTARHAALRGEVETAIADLSQLIANAGKAA